MKETLSATTVAVRSRQRAKHGDAVFIRIYDVNYHFPGQSLLARSRQKPAAKTPALAASSFYFRTADTLLLQTRKLCHSLSGETATKGPSIMAMYVSLLQFTDQGIRNVKDTIKRATAATAEAEKMGAKIADAFWTMGAYDVVLLLDAPDDETVSAFSLKLGSLGNVKSQTMRAFRREEMESILAKVK